ncbi:hypothetical protein LTR37_011402 [Vermiconidia calcicola]|uniref:Uncharacterized protein n=1 Tax=Vermiconidia calcicola TaxID=1690605 RepID=A0ACC3N292_9PEZI|nr:hypothetical protein LTR37_011402 [Vermiconidia calcicola]
MEQLGFAIAVLCLIALCIYVLCKALQPAKHITRRDGTPNDEKSTLSDPYHDIEPLRNFDWSTTEPIKIRPFKPKYHLTMALEHCPLSELVAIDNTYLERMQIRKSVMDQHPKETYQCYEPCVPAVMEMYEWIFGTYLPRRFPTMYRLFDSSYIPADTKSTASFLYNIPAGKYIALRAATAEEALYTLGYHVDDDILILLPLSTAPDGLPIYHLQAYVCCFPSGFRTDEKISLPLASIHSPVPGYKAKLEKSMDKFFAKLELGKAVRRVNWSITTNDLLYSQGGNHLYSGGKMDSGVSAETSSSSKPVGGGNAKTLDVDAPDVEQKIEQQKKDVVVENCRLRCERQTLHRLPNTKALVFMFKTYQYKLEDLKAEGSGPELAEAIPGLGQGSVPDMAFYKRGVVWGDKVVEYLRS